MASLNQNFPSQKDVFMFLNFICTLSVSTNHYGHGYTKNNLYMNAESQIPLNNSYDFTILFDKLDEALEEQKQHFNLHIKSDLEINNTIALFKEYQEDVVGNTYTTLTRG